jgi:hypothetical protein
MGFNLMRLVSLVFHWLSSAYKLAPLVIYALIGVNVSVKVVFIPSRLSFLAPLR